MNLTSFTVSYHMRVCVCVCVSVCEWEMASSPEHEWGHAGLAGGEDQLWLGLQGLAQGWNLDGEAPCLQEGP